MLKETLLSLLININRRSLAGSQWRSDQWWKPEVPGNEVQGGRRVRTNHAGPPGGRNPWSTGKTSGQDSASVQVRLQTVELHNFFFGNFQILLPCRWEPKEKYKDLEQNELEFRHPVVDVVLVRFETNNGFNPTLLHHWTTFNLFGAFSSLENLTLISYITCLIITLE